MNANLVFLHVMGLGRIDFIKKSLAEDPCLGTSHTNTPRRIMGRPYIRVAIFTETLDNFFRNGGCVGTEYTIVYSVFFEQLSVNDWPPDWCL